MEETERKNRTVVITGGSSGIGRALAKAFARHGDQVVITGRHENTLQTAAEAIGANCSWQRADVSQRDQVAAAVNAVVARSKKIDVLINNTGYSGFERGIRDYCQYHCARLYRRDRHECSIDRRDRQEHRRAAAGETRR